MSKKEEKEVVQPIVAAGYDSKPARKDHTESGLTQKQLAYIIATLKNPGATKTQNAKDAGLVNPPNKKATRKIIGVLGSVLAENGISETDIAIVFKDALTAIKQQRIGKDVYEDVPDHGVRLAAAGKLLDVAGYNTKIENDKGDINKVKSVFINMDFRQIEKQEQALKLITEIIPNDE